MPNNIIEQYRKKLQIDELKLDRELIEQAMIYFEVYEASINAISERDSAFDYIKLVAAELDQDFRQNATDTKEKITEAQIKAFVTSHKDHVKATEDYNVKKLEASLLEAMRASFEMRSKMLRELVSYYNSENYMTNQIKMGEKAGEEIEYNKARVALADKRETVTRARLKRG